MLDFAHWCRGSACQIRPRPQIVDIILTSSAVGCQVLQAIAVNNLGQRHGI